MCFLRGLPNWLDYEDQPFIYVFAHLLCSFGGKYIITMFFLVAAYLLHQNMVRTVVMQYCLLVTQIEKRRYFLGKGE